MALKTWKLAAMALGLSLFVAGSSLAQPALSDVAKAQAALRTVLDNKDSKPEEIKAALAALRDAKDKSKTTLATAQKELKELLTQRQEAVMVNMGYLD